MPQNYLNAFRGPNLAEIDRSAYSNSLLKNEVARLPQQNRMQDLAIQGAEQQFTDQQKQNAAGVIGRGFAIIAGSPRARDTARAFISSPDFQAAGKMLGLPLEQFSVTDTDEEEALRQQAAAWAQALGAQVQAQQQFGDPYEKDGALLQRGPGGEVRQVMPRPTVSQAGSTNAPSGYRFRQDGTLEPIPGGPAGRGLDAPSGYRYKQDGTLEPTPGGPADPSGPQARRNSMQLRKEYEDQEPVKQYRTVLPLYQRAATAPDNRAGDISVIYALGKMFDPTSVVREGELLLAQSAAPWLQQMASSINSQITGQGRLSPETRATIMQALSGQVEALRMPFEQERQRYSQYATDTGMTPDSVVGPDPADAFQQAPPIPRIGEVVDGYRYKGGDPASPSNWERQ